jgi:hypothetical protein
VNYFKTLPLWTWPIAILVGISVFLGMQLKHAHAEQIRLALKSDSTTAAADTTRVVSWRAQKVLGDSIAAVERRSVQVQMHADALDKALGRVSAALTSITAVVRTLNVKNKPGTVVTVDAMDTTIRKSTFVVDSTPFHVVADVKLPPPPRVGMIDLSVRLDTLRLRPRLQCGKPVDNVRPATILVETPKWLPAVIDSSRVDISACNPQLIQKRDWSPWWAIPAAFVAGAAVKAAISK